MPKPKTPTIKEKLEALATGKSTPTAVVGIKKPSADNLKSVEISAQTDRIGKDGKLVGSRGGKREGAGKPVKEETLIRRGIKALLDEQVMKEVDVTITDPKSGKTMVIKKPQVVLMMEMLFIEGYKNKNIPAAREWLDRALGKSAQPIFTDGDGDANLKFGIDIRLLLDRAWPVANQVVEPNDKLPG